MKKQKVVWIAVVTMVLVSLFATACAFAGVAPASNENPNPNETVAPTQEPTQAPTEMPTEDPTTKPTNVVGETVTADGYAYEINNGEATIIRAPMDQAETYIVPEMIEGCPVVAIADMAFYQRVYCTSVQLPSTLKQIEGAAFYRCHALKEIVIPKSVEYIFHDAFFRTSSLERIVVEKGNPYFCDIDGVLYSADKTIMHIYPEGRPHMRYVIPDGVTTISGLGYHPKVREMVIPASVVNFPDYSFCLYKEDVTFYVKPGSVAEAYILKYELQIGYE